MRVCFQDEKMESATSSRGNVKDRFWTQTLDDDDDTKAAAGMNVLTLIFSRVYAFLKHLTFSIR